MKKILFVCGRNLRRSPTAERIFRNSTVIQARSAGVAESSRRKIKENDLMWADVIMVMEQKHRSRIKSLFPDPEKHPPIEVLEIPDDFEWMDPELITLLETAVSAFLENEKNRSA